MHKVFLFILLMAYWVTTFAVTIQMRRDTAAAWSVANPVLASGEIGCETDTNPYRCKIGDGSTAWNTLPYFAGFTTVDTDYPADQMISAGWTFTSPVNVNQIDAIGAAAMTIGSVDVPSVTITTDGTGDTKLIVPGESINTSEITNAAITLAKQADLAAHRVIGRDAGVGTGVPQALTPAEIRAVTEGYDYGTAFPVASDFDGGTIPEGYSFYRQDLGVIFIYAQGWRIEEQLISINLYVDSTNGTDNTATNGWGSGTEAFKTIAYALAFAKGDNRFNTTINITGETYNENISIEGKNRIILQGTLATVESITAATLTVGSGATQGTVQDSELSGDNYTDHLVYFETDGQYRVIDSHAADTLTLVGDAPSSTTQNVTVYNWATILNSVTVNKCRDCQVINIETTGANYWVASECNWSIQNRQNRVKIGGRYFNQRCDFLMDLAVVNTGGSSIDLSYFSHGTVQWSKWNLGGSTALILMSNIGSVLFRQGSIANGEAGGNDADRCFFVRGNSYALFEANIVWPRLINCDWGIQARTGGMVEGTSTVHFSGNTLGPKDADASSFAYID